MTALPRPKRVPTVHRVATRGATPAAALESSRGQPRTLLEQLIGEREATQREICEQFAHLARKMCEKDATMSVRHLQRLAYGERNGQRSSPATRRVMRQLFAHSMDELLGPPRPSGSGDAPTRPGLVAVPNLAVDQPANAELAERIATAAHVDDTSLMLLAEQTDRLRMMDRQVSGLILRQQLDAHLATLRCLFEHTMTARYRIELAAQLADGAALAAWVALDRGDVDNAWSHHETAKLFAREAESPSLLAHAMVQQAFVLTEIGRPAGAIELAREARHMAGTAVPALLVSWLWAGEGEVLAAAGDGAGSRRAFDNAVRLLPTEGSDPELPYLQLDEAHLARWHGNALARLGDGTAIDHLYSALEAPDNSLRALAGLHVDLAHAHTAAGDLDEAEVHISQARDFAERAGSRRQLRRIQLLAA